MAPEPDTRAEPDGTAKCLHGGDGGCQTGRYVWVLGAAGLLHTQQLNAHGAHLPLSYFGGEYRQSQALWATELE